MCHHVQDVLDAAETRLVAVAVLNHESTDSRLALYSRFLP